MSDSIFWKEFQKHQKKIAKKGRGFLRDWFSQESSQSSDSRIVYSLSEILRVEASSEHGDVSDLTFEELRKLVGEDAFFDALQTFYEEHIDELIEGAEVEETDEGIVVHRALTVKNPNAFLDFLRGKKQSYEEYECLGVFWSYDEERVEAHWGSGSGTEVILTAILPYKSCDFAQTFSLWDSLSLGHDEAEIRAKKGAKVKIYGVQVGGERIEFEAAWHRC